MTRVGFFSICISVLFVALSIACGAASPSIQNAGTVRAPEVAHEDFSVASRYRIWIGELDLESDPLACESGTNGTTYELDSHGSLHAQEPGIHVYANHQAQSLQVEAIPEILIPCDANELSRRVAAPPSQGCNLALRTEERLVLATTPFGEEGNPLPAEHQRRLTDLVFIGDALFARIQEYTYTCGAHGNTTLEDLASSMRGGPSIALVPSETLLPNPVEAPNDECLMGEPAVPRLMSTTPVWTEGGFVLRQRFSYEVNYACSRQASYQVHAEATESRATEQLPVLPAPVAQFLSQKLRERDGAAPYHSNFGVTARNDVN